MTVSLARDKTPTQAQIDSGIDLEDRKVAGYLGSYDEFMGLITDVKDHHPSTYAKYRLMTQSWIKEARSSHYVLIRVNSITDTRFIVQVKC